MNRIKIPLHEDVFVSVRDLEPRIQSYLAERDQWLRRVSRELERWRLDKDGWNYEDLAKRYFFLFTIPAVESCLTDFHDPKRQHLVEGHFWLMMHARFVDSILDDDSSRVGYETFVFLANFCLAKALDRFRREKRNPLDLDSLWSNLHRMYKFQVRSVMPFGSVSFRDFTRRLWERGAPFFWLPVAYAAGRSGRPDRANEVFRGLKSFAGLFAALDLDQLIPDHMHSLNSPATILWQETDPNLGIRPRFQKFHARYVRWLEGSYRRAKRFADERRMVYTQRVLHSFWKVFRAREGLGE